MRVGWGVTAQLQKSITVDTHRLLSDSGYELLCSVEIFLARMIGNIEQVPDFMPELNPFFVVAWDTFCIIQSPKMIFICGPEGVNFNQCLIIF